MKNAFKSLLAVAVLLSLTACGSSNKSGTTSEAEAMQNRLDSIKQARIDLLEQVKTENLGDLVFIDQHYYTVYEEPSKSSPELQGANGPIQVVGPIVLSCDEHTDDDWYKIGDPWNNAVGWIRGDGITLASKESVPDKPQGLYISAYWSDIFAGIHKESGLAVGHRLLRRSDGSVHEIMLGKLIDNVYVFHYFVQVDIPGGRGNGDFDIGIGEEGLPSLRCSSDYLLRPASSIGRILPDLTRISSAELGELFEDQIGCTDDWNFCNYFYLNSDILCERYRIKI